MNNGFSKALGIADYDADPLRVASRQFDIGSTRSNITVLADRPSTNADGTTRRELDVEYVINYTDGTKLEKATQTLISGSSSGSTMADKSVCAVAENKTEWRFFGNRKVVNTFVNATNERKERALLATGDAMVPPSGLLRIHYFGRPGSSKRCDLCNDFRSGISHKCWSPADGCKAGFGPPAS